MERAQGGAYDGSMNATHPSRTEMNRSPACSRFGAAAILATALLAGCASLPAEEMARASAAIDTASAAVPAGSDVAEMGRAHVKLALSQRWVAAKDYGPARWLAEQAEVDAELALVRVATREAQRLLALREQAVVAARKVSGPAF